MFSSSFPVFQILYYDGQFDDARVNVTLACTAAAAGAVVANYVDCRELIKVYAAGIVVFMIVRCQDDENFPLL